MRTDLRAPAAILAGVFILAAGPPAARSAEAPAASQRILIVGTKEAPPFAMKGADGEWTGISIELWRRIAEQLHLRYELHETTLQGLIDETAAGSLDAAVAALTVTPEREEVLDFTQPFFATGLGIAVPVASAFDWFRLLGSLLSLGFVEALLGLLGVTLLVGVAVWLVERRHTEHFGGGRRGLVSSVWWSALTMTQAGAEQEPLTALGRFVAVAWMAASVIVIAVFTAGVTAQLTAKQLRGSVHGLGDLRSARVGAVAGTAATAFLARERITFRAVPTAQSGMEALKDGSLDALVYDHALLAWMAKERFASSVEVLDTMIAKQAYAIALPNDSALRAPIDRALVQLINTDWWQALNYRYFGQD